MDRGAWWARVHRVAKSWTQLSRNYYQEHQTALHDGLQTTSDVKAAKLPGCQRLKHDDRC